MSFEPVFGPGDPTRLFVLTACPELRISKTNPSFGPWPRTTPRPPRAADFRLSCRYGDGRRHPHSRTAQVAGGHRLSSNKFDAPPVRLSLLPSLVKQGQTHLHRTARPYQS